MHFERLRKNRYRVKRGSMSGDDGKEVTVFLHLCQNGDYQVRITRDSPDVNHGYFLPLAKRVIAFANAREDGNIRLFSGEYVIKETKSGEPQERHTLTHQDPLTGKTLSRTLITTMPNNDSGDKRVRFIRGSCENYAGHFLPMCRTLAKFKGYTLLPSDQINAH